MREGMARLAYRSSCGIRCWKLDCRTIGSRKRVEEDKYSQDCNKASFCRVVPGGERGEVVGCVRSA